MELLEPCSTQPTSAVRIGLCMQPLREILFFVHFSSNILPTLLNSHVLVIRFQRVRAHADIPKNLSRSKSERKAHNVFFQRQGVNHSSSQNTSRQAMMSVRARNSFCFLLDKVRFMSMEWTYETIVQALNGLELCLSVCIRSGNLFQYVRSHLFNLLVMDSLESIYEVVVGRQK